MAVSHFQNERRFAYIHIHMKLNEARNVICCLLSYLCGNDGYALDDVHCCTVAVNGVDDWTLLKNLTAPTCPSKQRVLDSELIY